MKILILEDNADRCSEFFKMFESSERLAIVNHAQLAIDLIASEEFDVIFLDHDLGGKAYVSSSEFNTGHTVASYICTSSFVAKKPLQIIIHSWNVPAAERMKTILEHSQNVGSVRYIPFGSFDATII